MLNKQNVEQLTFLLSTAPLTSTGLHDGECLLLVQLFI